MLRRFFVKIRMLIHNLRAAKFPIDSAGRPAIPATAADLYRPSEKSEEPHIIRFAARGEKEITEYTISEFEKVTGHCYLRGLEFRNEKTFRRIRKRCLYASQKGYIDSERKWLGALYGRQIRSHYIANVSIRWMDDTLGYGLFAEKDIQAWEFIGEYTGVVRWHNPFLRDINDYCYLYPTAVIYFGKHMIDAQDQGNEIRYANHSDDPNSEGVSVFCDGLFHMILRAIRDIPARTQITYNYGDHYWKSRPREPNVIRTIDGEHV